MKVLKPITYKKKKKIYDYSEENSQRKLGENWQFQFSCQNPEMD